MNGVLKQRFWEIDFLRGLAIIMMIIFHFFYDLNYFGVQEVNLSSGFWWVFVRIIATIFILLVGISLTISYSRVKSSRKLFKKYFFRGLKIFSWGLIITSVTWLFLKQGFIVFGILHFIGISVILAYPFLRIRSWNFLLGIVFILIGVYLQNIVFNSYWLVWLGLTPRHFYTVDYFPLFPWLGVVLSGLFLGNLLYPNGNRRLRIPDLSNSFLIRFFCFLGRNSLLIYLIHQPVLIIFLHLFVL